MILTVVAMLGMTMAFAENEKLNTANSAEAFNMKVNYGKLGQALGLTMDQLETVKDIHSEFCADMLNAASVEGDERKAMIDKAVKKDVKYMRYVLTGEQYGKYLTLLNATLANRGLK